MRPKSITIVGIEYPFWFHADALKAGGVRGQYLGDEQKILMDKRLPEATWLRTVLHESLHGVFAVSTLTAGPESSRELSEDLEEKVITLLERELPSLFRDNPWLLEVLK